MYIELIGINRCCRHSGQSVSNLFCERVLLLWTMNPLLRFTLEVLLYSFQARIEKPLIEHDQQRW